MPSGKERRRYPRFKQNDVVRLTLLAENGRSDDARIVDASVSGIRLTSNLEITPGALIKVEWKDTLLLGEVLYTQPSQSNEGSVIGVELTRALYGMSELRRLNANLTGAAQATGRRQQQDSPTGTEQLTRA